MHDFSIFDKKRNSWQKRKKNLGYFLHCCSRGLHSHTRNADLHSTMNSSSSVPTTTGHIFCATKCNLPDFIGNTYSWGNSPRKWKSKLLCRLLTLEFRPDAFLCYQNFSFPTFFHVSWRPGGSLGEQCVSFLWSVSHSCVCAKAHERTNFGIPPICFFCVRLLLLPLPLSFPIFRVFQSLIVQCASFRTGRTNRYLRYLTKDQG